MKFFYLTQIYQKYYNRKWIFNEIFYILSLILSWNSVCNLYLRMWMSAQSCQTLSDPMNYSPPGSSVHGIFQARTLQQVAISHSRGSSWPRDQTHVSCIFCIGRQIITEPPRKLILYLEHVSFQTSHSSSAQQLYVASGLHTEQQRLELRGEHYS